MFDAVRFHAYKCLADVTIELGRMTLLVGANASGKSSVLDGLHLLCQLGVPHPDDRNLPRPWAVFSRGNLPVRLRTYGREGALEIEASTGKGEERTRAFGVVAIPASAAAPQNFTIEFTTEGGGSRSLKVSAPTPPPGSEEFFRELDGRGFGQVVRLRLDPAKVAGFARDSQQPRVEHDGQGTAAVIAWLAEQRAPELEAIEADLQRVVPRARRLLPERAQQDGLGRLFALEMEGGVKVPADLLSEGTLLTIGLLTVLHGRPAPRLILLDDFDRALHPTAQKQLVACVKDMLARNVDLQFVCTTHSPYVLDLFDAEDVRVLRADAQGLTRVRKLTEHPEWVNWKETLKAGEFWSYVGEDWLDGAAHGG